MFRISQYNDKAAKMTFTMEPTDRLYFWNWIGAMFGSHDSFFARACYFKFSDPTYIQCF